MIEIYGDFWNEAQNMCYDAICFTSNKIVTSDGRLVMGGGIAKDFRDKFRGIDYQFGEMLSNQQRAFSYDGLLIELDHSQCYDRYNIAFPTKNHWKNPSDIELIIKSAKQLKLVSSMFNWFKILMTRPGCGLGGLKWEDVKKELEPILDTRFVVIEKE